MKNIPISRYSNHIIILALCLGSMIVRYLALSQTAAANGWDSYFYLVQIKSWIETGQMHSSEHSLIYPFIILCYWLTNDYILGIKLGISLLAGVFTWQMQNTAGVIYAHIQKAKNEIGHPFELRLVVAALTLFSPHLTYFAAQFPKNLLGMVLLLAFIGRLHQVNWAVLLHHDHSRNKPVLKYITLLGLFIANYFCHRFTFALSVVYLVFFMASIAWARVGERSQNFKNVLKNWLIPITGIVIFSILLSGSFFPGLANWSDLGRMNGLFSVTPQFSPWSFVQSFGYERVGLVWVLEIGFSVIIFIFSIILIYKEKENRILVSFLGIFCLLLFPFTTWSLTGLSYRMFMVFILMTNLLIPIFYLGKKVLYGFSAFLILASFGTWRSYQPVLHDPDYQLFEKITNKTLSHFRNIGTDKPELIVAHNALAEYYTFSTSIDAMPWLPEYEIEPQKLWRIAADIHWPTLQYYINDTTTNLGVYLGAGYGLIPEYQWRTALQKAYQEGDSSWVRSATSWKNPHSLRPGWLLRRKADHK